MACKVVIFDAYGTLFDVGSAARAAAEEPGRDGLAACWMALAEDWRLKQLQYTWHRAIVGQHADFWQVTQESLDWALERHGLHEDPELRERLLTLYLELEAYPEVRTTLTELRERGQTCAILSNGAPEMLSSATASAGIGDLLDDLLSVEAVGIYKPAAKTYQLVLDRFGCERGEVTFVSSNGWDAAGASLFGFNTVWVNRRNEPVDRLPGRPAHILDDLGALPDLLG
ncbi:2-haloacid dehalogenase [Poseidonocella pacifica]|uniref:(S)-2-haloacid dehalogenase n=1 Tax=Poseidonocella pacifica TaxID=871651 RepID=A0A1I0WIE2_9RHOB|nr:haloacid dehalogenase type II [Poseidonocella pacifica]SFA88555.1 2-haloacid dehalogenase [Poseidonocella pacifica]